MTNTFRVTFEIVTPDSAEQGEIAAFGYEVENVRLRDAIDAAQCRRGGYEDCGRWFTSIDAVVDAGTGAQASHSVHPPRTITPASYARLARLLTGRR
jgi:hypothetical protein